MSFSKFILTTCACCVIAVCVASAQAAVIEFRSNIAVESAVVRLGDIADITDGTPATVASLSRITLQAAPRLGEKGLIKLEVIEEKLRANGVDLTEIELVGDTTIEVQRKSPTGPNATGGSQSLTSSPSQKVLALPAKVVLTSDKLVAKKDPVPAAAVSLDTKSRNRARDILTEVVRDRLATTAEHLGRPHIFLQMREDESRLILNAVPRGIRVIEGIELRENRYELTFETEDSEGVLKTFTLQVELRMRPRIVAAKSEFPEGRVLQANDIEMKEVDDLRNGVSDVSLIVGKALRRSVKAGEAIKPDAVQEPFLVKKGEDCLVVSDVSGIRTSLLLKAEKDGRRGDLVTFVSDDRKKPLRARVTATRVAEISDVRDTKPSVNLVIQDPISRQPSSRLPSDAASVATFGNPRLPSVPPDLATLAEPSRLESPFPSPSNSLKRR